MDNDLKNLIANTVIDGLLFLEKIQDQLTLDQKLERSNVSRLFKHLLSVLDQPGKYYAISDLYSGISLPTSEVKHLAREETYESKFQRSISTFLPLKRDVNLFRMSSNLPTDCYTKVFIIINNQHEGFYYCMLERNIVLLGLELNDLPPEYLLQLEMFEINRGKGSMIKLKNNSFEIVMQFDSGNTYNDWLSAFVNAKSSIYTYIRDIQQEDISKSYENRKDTPEFIVYEDMESLKSPKITKSGCKYLTDITGNFDFVKTKSRKLTKKLSTSLDSLHIDATSLSNFEISREKYSKSIAMQKDKSKAEKVPEKSKKSRTLPNGARK